MAEVIDCSDKLFVDFCHEIRGFKFEYFSADSNCQTLNCEYDCQKSLEGGVCICPAGKTVSNDSRSCIGKFQIDS